VVQKGGYFPLGNLPFLGGRVEMGGEGTLVGVLNIGICGCLVVGQGRAEKKAKQIKSKAYWRRDDGFMDSGKFGLIISFEEDVEAFWSEQAVAFSCRVINASYLSGHYGVCFG